MNWDRSTHMAGIIEAIFLTPEGGGEPEAADAVQALAGRGLEGDRYGAGTGTFWREDEPKQQVTLIEAEAIEAAVRDYGIELEARETRRNILTRGIALNHLVGRTFRVGEAVCTGVELSEPCGYLESKTRAGVRKSLVHRGGIRATIDAGGRIAVGDTVRIDD